MLGRSPKPRLCQLDPFLPPAPQTRRMALSDKQLWTATKVDTKVRKLLAAGIQSGDIEVPR